MFPKFKQKFLFFLSFFFLNTKIMAKEHLNVGSIDREAQDFMYARDYEKATQIYQQLLAQSLPKWQQALILYNLGTVELAQQQNKEAINFYGLIPFDSIVNPQLFRMISFNKALAYLNQAETLPLDPLAFELEEQLEYYQLSLKQFEATQKTDCLLQQLQGEASSCEVLDAVSFGIDQVKWAIQKNKMKQRQNLLQEKNFYNAFFVLSQSLMRIDHLFNSISWTEISSDLKRQYHQYSINQAESSLPLWEQIQIAPLELKQKKILDQAAVNFHDFLVQLQQGKISESKDQLQESLKQIENMEQSSKNNLISKLLIQYHLILLEEEITLVSLQALQKDQQELIENGNKTLIQANEYLDKSVDYFSDQPETSYFFLNAAFQQIKNSNISISDSPEVALKQALIQAWEVRKLTRLFLDVSKDIPLAASIVKKVQENVIEAGKSFFMTTLSFQKKNFQDRALAQHCQVEPWNLVLPLFSKGFQAALLAYDLIHLPSQAMIEQEHTLQNWKEAFRILSKPPSDGGLPNSTGKQKEMDQFNDLLLSIQEMEAQDMAEKKSTNLEQDTW